MSRKIERSSWTAKNGSRHEAITISYLSGVTADSFDSPEEAEQVANNLLRLAAEWRQEIAAKEQSTESAL